MVNLNSPTVAEFCSKYGFKTDYVFGLIRQRLIPIVHIGDKPIRPYRIDEEKFNQSVNSKGVQGSLKIKSEIARTSRRSTQAGPSMDWALKRRAK